MRDTLIFGQAYQGVAPLDPMAAKRRAYFDRFVFSQKFAQVDPWSERVSGKDKHEFRSMATIDFPVAAGARARIFRSCSTRAGSAIIGTR
jgi:hypothetical protein